MSPKENCLSLTCPIFVVSVSPPSLSTEPKRRRRIKFLMGVYLAKPLKALILCLTLLKTFSVTSHARAKDKERRYLRNWVILHLPRPSPPPKKKWPQGQKENFFSLMNKKKCLSFFFLAATKKTFDIARFFFNFQCFTYFLKASKHFIKKFDVSFQHFDNNGKKKKTKKIQFKKKKMIEVWVVMERPKRFNPSQ